MPFSFINTQKELIPLNKSNQVFWNRKAKEIGLDFQKGQPEFFDFFYINDHPLCRLGGMIFWYGIGDKQFDIREMRRLGGFPKQCYKADESSSGPFKALNLVANQLAQISMKHNLEDFLKPILIPIQFQNP